MTITTICSCKNNTNLLNFGTSDSLLKMVLWTQISVDSLEKTVYTSIRHQQTNCSRTVLYFMPHKKSISVFGFSSIYT